MYQRMSLYENETNIDMLVLDAKATATCEPKLDYQYDLVEL